MHHFLWLAILQAVIHLYKDPVKNAYVWSRFHIHSDVLPRRADGSFCSRSIATRENIIKLNDMIEEMTQREFGVQYNTGEEPRRKTVEALKAESAAAELEDISQDLTKAKAEVEVKKNEYAAFERNMKIKVYNVKKQEKANADREIALDVRAAKVQESEKDAERIKAEAEKKAEQITAAAEEKAESIEAEAKKGAERITTAAEEKAEHIEAEAKKKAAKTIAEAEAIKKRLEARETAHKKADKAEASLNAPAAPNARPTRFDGAAAGYFGK